MLNITLKDGKVLEIEKGTTAYQVAENISKKLAKFALVAKFNGELIDLGRPLTEDGELEILDFASEEGLDAYRHSSAHIMAQAVQNLFPDVKFGIGPAIKDGFYYDFDTEHKFTPEDLEKIEKEVERIIKEDYQFERKEVSREEALSFFKEKNEQYKVELIEALPEDSVITMYTQGSFTDLCRGPHLPSTGKLKAIKLMNLAGAYWRGDEKNKMLQRIYGTSFPKKSQLDDYLKRLDEAKKRDHRRLGKELDLFTIEEEGPGFPIFLPKGMILRNELEDFMRDEYRKWEYEEIKTPIILNRSLWEQSGHWDHYKENMYFTQIDDVDYSIKPMNCPGCMLAYKYAQHSYRELPIRYAEMGLVHRHEKSGVLHGLMRVRAFTQDDAHIFMLYSQITDEIKKVIEMIDEIYKVFGFSYNIELSTRPEKAMGDIALWDKATDDLRQALEDLKLPYVINEGDGAFYGPKIDFHLEDSIGRTWQCGTIQLDFQMPEKFDINYIGEDGNKHRPAMIHRAIFGSVERFIGILIEHYAGAFPTWLAPVQARVLSISENNLEYCQNVVAELKKNGIRAELDVRNEKIGYKIREAQVQKIPYMLVVGDQEMENNTVAVRPRAGGKQEVLSVEQFATNILDEIANKR
ncbi:threonine--tRNA ligase [Clostridia bacterium]|nr:threonine--tRNA ligase [Clostridia bacterium]